MSVLYLKRSCPICGEKSGEYLYHIAMTLPRNFPIQGEYDVVSCCRCGFIYADVDGDQGNYNEYYAKCNMYSAVSGLKKETYDNACNYRIDFLQKYLKKEDKIVDIGCGGAIS